MSWFQSTGLNSAFDTLTETVQKAKETVQDAIPTEHKELLAKLTLNTDEMISERQNFRDEATRKEQAKNRLDKLLPWETSIKNYEILVEECKEAILELSSRKETFFGPYEMPLLNVQFEEVEDMEEEEEDADQTRIQTDDTDEKYEFHDNEKEKNIVEVESQTDTAEKENENGHVHLLPSEDSRQKLRKLEPLPPLLEKFDLDDHVGLIQKILKEDPNLVNMQATFSGGGAREETFWRNYFFHCAFTRYEAGLSIDEIWSYQNKSNSMSQQEKNAECNGEDNISSNKPRGNDEEEAEIINKSGGQDTCSQNILEMATADSPSDASEVVSLSEGSPCNGFELVDDSPDEETGLDPALDELEAEIARELED